MPRVRKHVNDKLRKIAIAQFHKEMEVHMKAIGEHRDAMRLIIEDYAECISDAEEGLAAIESGLDTISQTV
jgi:hypothetical protein